MNRIGAVSLALLLSNFATSLAAFMTLPLFAVFLKEQHGFTAGTIGLVVGLPALVGCLLAVAGGQIADRIGMLAVLALGFLLSGIGYALIALMDTKWELITVSIGIGIGRALTQPPLKALMACGGDVVFRYRYITICIAAIVGPLLGVLFGASAVELVFFAAAGIFVLLCIGVVVLKRHLLHAVARGGNGARENSAHSGWQIIQVFSEWRLLLIVLSGGAVFAAFAQFESMIPLVLASNTERPERVFAGLLVANALLGIVLQFVHVKMLPANGMSVARLAGMGGLAIGAALVMFAFAEGHTFTLLTATAVFTVGEVLSIPAGEMLIERIAPTALRASYFGAGEMRYIGFFLGPWASGHLLEASGPVLMFLFGAALSVLGWLGFVVLEQRVDGSRSHKPEEDSLWCGDIES